MTTEAGARVAADYLSRLERAGRSVGLPESRRAELEEQISDHLDDATAAAAAEDSASAVLDAIDRLGDPEAIVAEAQRELGLPATAVRNTPGVLEAVALVGMCLGWLVFGLGTLVAITALLASRAWTGRDKLIGIVSALLPIATLWIVISGANFILSDGTEPANQGLAVGDALLMALGVLPFLAPFASAVYLWRRAYRST